MLAPAEAIGSLANAADLVGSEGVHHNDVPSDSDGARNWATLT